MRPGNNAPPRKLEKEFATASICNDPFATPLLLWRQPALRYLLQALDEQLP
jgi:hypothetical protein